MKFGRVSTLFVATASILVASSFTEIIQAQTVTQNKTTPVTQRLIQLKNVEPEVMAYLLDPDHNEMPSRLRSSRTDPNSKSFNTKINSPFPLPTGIQSVSPIAPKNALLVLGTAASIDRWQGIITLLDLPLRQVEVEATFVQITPAGLKDFGVHLDNVSFDTQAKGNLQMVIIRSNYQQTLDSLLKHKRAKLLASPKIVATNNREAQLVTSQFRPATVGYKDQDGKFHEVPSSTPSTTDPDLKISSSFELVVVPTINNNGTTTLLIEPKPILQLVGAIQNQSIPLSEPGSFSTNVKDGDTIALVGIGMSSSMFRGVETDKNTPTSDLLILVTTRVARPVNEPKIEN